MPKLVRPLLIMTVIVALPLVGAALLAGPLGMFSLGDWVAELRTTPPERGELLALLVLLLAGDILLPVPSAPAITLVGAYAGWPAAALAAWVGLTLGGGIALLVTRVLGQSVVERLVRPEELTALRASTDKHGAWLVLVSRPLPIVAEAVLLTVGLIEPRWWRTFATMALGNAVVAATLAWLGERAEANEALALGIVLSIVVPLAATWYVRRALMTPATTEP